MKLNYTLDILQDSASELNHSTKNNDQVKKCGQENFRTLAPPEILSM